MMGTVTDYGHSDGPRLEEGVVFIANHRHGNITEPANG